MNESWAWKCFSSFLIFILEKVFLSRLIFGTKYRRNVEIYRAIRLIKLKRHSCSIDEFAWTTYLTALIYCKSKKCSFLIAEQINKQQTICLKIISISYWLATVLHKEHTDYKCVVQHKYTTYYSKRKSFLLRRLLAIIVMVILKWLYT